MKFGSSRNNNNTFRKTPSQPPTLPPPQLLPQDALQWSTAAATAAAISYADRGTSAIVASSLLEELHWSESQLGDVQSAFFVGYALTQVLGGLLGGTGSISKINPAGNNDASAIRAKESTGKSGGYRTVVPISLFFTAITTLCFPIAATVGGPYWASADRFCLGLLEGLLLPAAMAGVSATTTVNTETNNNMKQSEMSKIDSNNTNNESKINKATASSLVIAGCYMGSAWAYLSAWFLFSPKFQIQMSEWGYSASIWPMVFYLNGVLSILLLVSFREEFNLSNPLRSRTGGQHALSVFSSKKEGSYIISKMDAPTKEDLVESPIENDLWKDTLSVAKETLLSKSGRAILGAQVGQGALLYSIASYGPLYLERVNAIPPEMSSNTVDIVTSATDIESTILSPTYTMASIAASSLILPQLTQALVGITIGAAADELSGKVGTRLTRRALQLASGVGPAIILWYLSQLGGASEGTTVGLLSPELLFGAAQTVSALSLGAVSVSHLDIATPSKAGAVYALGNVAAAASGSLVVNVFGRLLEAGPRGTSKEMNLISGSEFSLPFQLVAILSGIGSLIYGCTVEAELEIGYNQTSTDLD